MKKFILVFMGMGLILTSCKEDNSAEEMVLSLIHI